jgi:Flp pilus assembly protein CpaB
MRESLFWVVLLAALAILAVAAYVANKRTGTGDDTAYRADLSNRLEVVLAADELQRGTRFRLQTLLSVIASRWGV